MHGEKNDSFPKRKKNYIVRRAVAAALVLMMVGSPFTPVYSGLNDRISIVASADESTSDVLMTINGTEVTDLSGLDDILDGYEDQDLTISLNKDVVLDDAKSLLYLDLWRMSGCVISMRICLLCYNGKHGWKQQIL